MHKLTARICRNLLVALPVLMPVVSSAQTDSDGIEEIIVTATKREASLHDVAASVSQIGGYQLEARGIANIESLSYQIPSLQFGALGENAYITLRGIGTTVDSGVAEPAVATYVDGVFLPRSTMSGLRQLDLEKVEVLRGPQGTLYGRNATGGSINFVSRAPSQDFEVRARTYLENRNGWGTVASVSGPVGGLTSYRLSLGREHQDGYAKVVNTGQDLLGTDATHARLAFQIRPSEDLVIDLSAQQDESDAALFLQQLLSPALAVTQIQGLRQQLMLPSLGENNQTTEPNRTYGDGAFSGDSSTTIVSARLNWTSNSFSLRSVTGMVNHDVTSSFDADATDHFLVNAVNVQRPSKSLSQELNFYGDVGNVSWLAGVYWYEEEFSLSLPLDFLNLDTTTFQFTTLRNFVAGHVEEDTRTLALFADVTWAVTDLFRINFGARQNNETKKFMWRNPLTGQIAPSGEQNPDDLLGKLGVQFDVSEQVNLYLQWQQGVKSGGHQLSLPSQFEGEEIDSLEAGVKYRTDDGRLTLNASAFQYDYANLQATTTIPPTTTLIHNADAEILGLEAELVWHSRNDAFNLNLGLSFLDSEYTDFELRDEQIMQTVSVDGEDLIRAPSYTMNLGLEWMVPLSGFFRDLRIRADIYSSDSFKLTFIDYPETRQSAFTTGNLSVILASADSQYQLRLYVNNVADEVTLNNGSYLATLGGFIGQYTEPRNYGVGFTFSL